MVEIKRKVTLRTKTSQPEEKPATEVTPEVQLSASQQEPTPTPPPPTEPTTNAKGSKGGVNWKEWLAAFVLATLLWGGYHLYNNSQGNDAQDATTVAKTDSADAQKDSTQTAQADSTTKVKPEADGNNVCHRDLLTKRQPKAALLAKPLLLQATPQLITLLLTQRQTSRQRLRIISGRQAIPSQRQLNQLTLSKKQQRMLSEEHTVMV